MDRFDRLARLSSGIGLACGVVLASATRTWLKDLSLPEWATLLIDFTVVSSCAVLIRLFAEGVLMTVRPLRRVLLNRQYVEGTWIDVIWSAGKVPRVGLIRIEPSGSSLRYCGENVDVNGHCRGTFTSEMVSLSWPELKFKYRSADTSASMMFSQGYGEIQFTERDGPPCRYVGHCVDAESGERHHLEGWRISNPDVLADLDDPERQHKRILEIAARYFLESHGTALVRPAAEVPSSITGSNWQDSA